MRVILFLLLITSTARAGFYDSIYFEPTIACVAAGAIGYSADSDMKKAAIYCAGAAAVTGLINLHFQNKYGSEFEPQKEFLNQKLNNYKMLENQLKTRKENPHFSKDIEILEPRILPNGQGIGRRVRQKIILKDSKDRVGL